MQVNFLPVQDMPQSSQSGLSMSSVPSLVNSIASDQAKSKHVQDHVSVQQNESLCGVEDVHSLVSIAEPENDSILPVSEERTRECVSRLRTPSQQPESLEGNASEPSADLTDDVLT